MRLVAHVAKARLKVWTDFATADECKQLIELARPRLTRSTVLNRSNGGSDVMDVRTSQGASFAKDEYPVLTDIATRAADTLGVRREQLEPLQIIRYGVGDKYEPHNDWFDPADSGSTPALAQGGQRTKTLLLYLNTPAAGGDTSFPDAGAHVAAVEGNAAQFEYPTATHADACLHGGTPVASGEKWAVNVWARERDFGTPPAAENAVATPWVLNADDCAKLRAFYDANAHRAEGAIDYVIRVRPEDQLQGYVDRVKQHTDAAFPGAKVVETVVLARIPADTPMVNHADNVRWNGVAYEPNHTPNRTHTCVVTLNDGDGATTFTPAHDGTAAQTVVPQREGYAHIHRCGPNFHHQVAASSAPRYTFIVWFKHD